MTGKIKLVHSGGNAVSLAVPTSNPSASEVEFKLPQSDGSSGQALVTDASGNLSFASVAAGKLLQIQQTAKTDTYSASIGKHEFSGAAISVNITPANSSNKILLIANLTIGLASDNDIGFAFFKAGSVITGATADASGSAARIHAQGWSGSFEQQHTIMGIYLDTAGGTSQITYDCRLRHGNNSTSGHSIYLNRDGYNNTGDMDANAMSTLTAIEVAA